jgi:murein L,D-transpeptidase YafK
MAAKGVNLLGAALCALLLCASQPLHAGERTAKPGRLDDRLATAGLARGSPIFIRIFKQESELELWMQRNGRFERFATYSICYWDGVLGPKLLEGDKQAPEGFYLFGEGQLRWYGRWLRGLDIDYPNAFDRANGRTGSAIYIHGGCNSIGCFAMTDPVIDEIFELAVNALDAGQRRVAVHVFPFRMTQAKMAERAESRWIGFWRDLKEGYDHFEEARTPPRVAVCDGEYRTFPGPPGYDGSERLALTCEAPPEPRDDRPTAWGRPPSAGGARHGRLMTLLADVRRNPPKLPASYRTASAVARTAKGEIESRGFDVLCNPGLPSCRRWIMLKQRQIRKGKSTAASGKTRKKSGI